MPTQIIHGTPYAFEQVALDDITPVGLDPDLYFDTTVADPAARQKASYAIISAEDPFYYRIDGGDPDKATALGMYSDGTTQIILTGLTAIQRFKAVSSASTSTMNVTYFHG